MDRLGPFLLGPSDTPENGIYTGDARELAKAIPDESIDLIFCDPIYQNIDDYRWLAETAARVLKQNRGCLAFCGIATMDYAIAAMRSCLSYRWMLGGFYVGRLIPYRWFPCIWAEKGRVIRAGVIWDMSPVRQGHRLPDADSANHKWQKPVDWIARYMNAFVTNGIVLDPFTGGGTVPAVCKMLGRKYLAFEIDPDMAETARERVRNTQMPLFVLEPEQVTMELADGS